MKKSNQINITTITNNHHTVSEFGNAFISLQTNKLHDAYDLGNITDFLPPGQLQYRISRPNPTTADWHVEPDPYGRLIIYLSGKYKITVGTKNESESRIFNGGDLLFFNDQTGLGHITEVLEEGIALTYMFIQDANIILN